MEKSEYETEAAGNGRLNAVSNALKKAYGFQFDLVTYQEHALSKVPVQRRLPMWESENQMAALHGELVLMQILSTLLYRCTGNSNQ